MIVPSARPSKLVFSSLIMAAVMATIQLAHAKTSEVGKSYMNTRHRLCLVLEEFELLMATGGCAAFGHSCYGGHGKRTDPMAKADREEVRVVVPVPSGDIRTLMTGEEPQIPVEFFDGYQSDGEDSNLVQVYPNRDISDVLRLSPIFQKWLAIVHRREDSMADGN